MEGIVLPARWSLLSPNLKCCPTPTAISYLILTVLFETFGTACIQAGQQFSRLWPCLGVVLGYGSSFWFLSQALKSLPLDAVYATWSGFGIINITIISYVIFGQRIDWPGLFVLKIVCAGIVIMHLFSGPVRS